MVLTSQAARRAAHLVLVASLLVTSPVVAQDAGGSMPGGNDQASRSGQDYRQFSPQGWPAKMEWFVGRWQLVNAYVPGNLDKEGKTYWTDHAKDDLRGKAVFVLTLADMDYNGTGIFAQGGAEKLAFNFDSSPMSLVFGTARAYDVSGRPFNLSKVAGYLAVRPQTCWGGERIGSVKLTQCAFFLFAHRPGSDHMFLYLYFDAYRNPVVRVLYEFERASP